VAVYAISKNEERHVERFLAHCAEADVVVVADTGSDDGTVAALQAGGATVHQILISPWRFDDARNAALALVPADIDVCISLDLDELLQPGWREALVCAWIPGTTRLRYKFIASWTKDGQPGTVFMNERVHARRGYRWRMPIHELVTWCGEGMESIATSEEFCAEHHPDQSKSRGNYLPMLQRSAAEEPNDPRVAHYLGREYYFWRDYASAVLELQRSLELPQAIWRPQRAEACRLIGKCHDAQGNAAEALRWYWQAVVEHPTQREPWVDLGQALYQQQDFAGGYYASRRALAITQQAADYFNEPTAWGHAPHDVLSVCAWNLGLTEEAEEHSFAAARLSPHDGRLQANAEFFRNRRTASESA
jgi:tetratricopeptide (TPR) repeat protein